REPHREREFRRRTGGFKEKNITPVFCTNFGNQFTELPRKMPGVISNHDARFDVGIVLSKVFPGIVHQPLGRPAEMVEIHCVGPNAWELRTRAAGLTACFGAGDNLSYRPPSKASCAEGEGLKKPIV